MSVFEQPTHPYTLGLLGSVHSLDAAQRGSLQAIPGSPPSLVNLPTGCAFRPRCRFELGPDSACVTSIPELSPAGESRSACHLPATTRVELMTRLSA